MCADKCTNGTKSSPGNPPYLFCSILVGPYDVLKEVERIFYQETNVCFDLTGNALFGCVDAPASEERYQRLRIVTGRANYLLIGRSIALRQKSRAGDEKFHQRIGDRYIMIKIIEFNQNLFIAILKGIYQRQARQAENSGRSNGTGHVGICARGMIEFFSGFKSEKNSIISTLRKAL